MSVFLVMLPSPTEIRKESSLHCILGYLLFTIYLVKSQPISQKQ
jgi:hypothetical protein